MSYAHKIDETIAPAAATLAPSAAPLTEVALLALSGLALTLLGLVLVPGSAEATQALLELQAQSGMF